MTTRETLLATIVVSGLVVLAPLAEETVVGIAVLKDASQRCEPGFVRKTVREARSCLGDYKKRVANEPITFCVRTRTSCVRAASDQPSIAAGTEAK